jgi:hypothetical protein
MMTHVWSDSLTASRKDYSKSSVCATKSIYKESVCKEICLSHMASTNVQPDLCKASLIFPPPVLQNSHATDFSPYLLMRTD